MDHNVALRRFLLLGRRVALPVEVLPGEGLADVLFRAAALNGYLTSSIVAKMLGLNGHTQLSHQSLCKIRIHPKDAADILGTPSDEDLHPLMYGPTQDGLGVFFFGRTLRVSNFRSTRAVSPLALRKSCYQRAIWSLRGISFDPETLETLIFECPHCRNPLTFRKTFSISYCPSCHENGIETDLRDFPQRVVEVSDPEALAYVTRLVDPLHSVSDLVIHDDLIEYGPGQLYEVAVSLASLLEQPFLDQATLRGVGIKHRIPEPSYLASAGRALQDWPSGFDSFVVKLTSSFSYVFGELGRDGRGGPLTLLDTSIKPDLRRKLVRRGSEVLASTRPHFGILSGCNAKFNGEIDEDFAWAPAIRPGQAKSTDGAYSCNSVPNILHGRPPMTRSEREISRLLGIPSIFVRGLLEPTPAKESCTANEARGIALGGTSFSSMDGLRNREAFSIEVICANLVKRRINPWPAIFRAIGNGALSVEVRGALSRTLVRQVFTRELDVVLEVIRGSQDGTPLGFVSLSVADAARLLGVSEPTVYLLQKQHALPGHPLLQDVWDLQNDFILVSEVRCRLKMAGECLGVDLIAAELKSAGIPSFRHGGAARTSLRPRMLVEDYFGQRLFPRV